MSDPSRPTENHPPQPGNSRPGWVTRLRHFELREAWWAFLDAWESRRALRVWTYSVVGVLILVGVLWFGVYPRWAQRNAIRMARQWIEAGQPGYAAETVQKAIEANPKEPELWMLAAELARLNKQGSMEVQYMHQAVLARPGESKYVLEWASAALRADKLSEAEQALAGLRADELAQSSHAQRMFGEIQRRKGQLVEARNHFEAALKIDGSGGVNELPLGLCLLSMRDAAERQRGLDMLSKLADDKEWGAGALRVLLTDASLQNDRAAMAKWAEALRTNPRCTVGDMPNCLAALVRADEAKYSEVMARLKQAHLANPESAAQLIGWLNQIGRSAEALEWMRTLPEANLKRPPLVVSKAEALRQVGDWMALKNWVLLGEWDGGLDFLRWAYAYQAARSLGDEQGAAEFWRLLDKDAQKNNVHALFAGSTIFSWGLVGEAETLWWHAAEQNNNIAIEALGTLARHYQVRRDAAGQYKVFNQWHTLHPLDDAVSNNFAFFAALTGNREQLAEQLARENAVRQPTDSTYQATHAFVLLMRHRPEQALKVIKPLAAEAEKSPAVAFVYGLTLAGTGEKAEARKILQKIDPATLTLREVELIKTALGD
jgi:tetratricopeptide (TPR) repeat protein